ncbi:hypothetical protein YC2023_045302 [Brassica napus]
MSSRLMARGREIIARPECSTLLKRIINHISQSTLKSQQDGVGESKLRDFVGVDDSALSSPELIGISSPWCRRHVVRERSERIQSKRRAFVGDDDSARRRRS